MEQGFLAGRRDREDRSVTACATLKGCAIEGAVDVDQGSNRVQAVTNAFSEIMEYGFGAAGGDAENRSVCVLPAGTGIAVEYALDVDERCCGMCAVVSNLKL